MKTQNFLLLVVLTTLLILPSTLSFEEWRNTCQCTDPTQFYPPNLKKCIPKELPETDPSHIPNCKIHKYENGNQTENKKIICLQCDPGFYEEDGLCVQHLIPQCLHAVKPFSSIKCLQCEEGYYPKLYSPECVKNPIEGQEGYDVNCEEYSEDMGGNSQCIKCMKTWRLGGQNDCYQNPEESFTGCVRWKNFHMQGTKCHECELKDTMYPNHDEGVCKTAGEEGDASFIENCENYTIDEDGIVHCTCIENHFKKIMQNGTTTCEPYPIEGQEGYVENCEVYKFETDRERIVCHSCANGMKSEVDFGTCEVNDNPVANCYKWGWTGFGDGCFQCRDGYVSIDNFKSCISCEEATNLPEPVPTPIPTPIPTPVPTPAPTPTPGTNTDSDDNTNIDGNTNPDTDPTNPIIEDPSTPLDPVTGDPSNPEDKTQSSLLLQQEIIVLLVSILSLLI